MAEIVVVYIDGMTLTGRSETVAAGIENKLKSSLPAVAVFLKRPRPSTPPFFNWDEISGNSAFAVQENPDGVALLWHDTAPLSTRIKQANADDTVEPIRDIEGKLARILIGQGAVWDVFDSGSGTLYFEKLAEAKTLVGFGS